MDGLREHPAQGESLQNNHMQSILNRLFPGFVWIHDEYLTDNAGNKIKTSVGKSLRPDFRCDQLHLIIEIDGDNTIRRGHFSSAATCIDDKLKTQACEDAGYTVVRIPPYVQLDSSMVSYYFGKFNPTHTDKLYEAASEHGFAHPQILLPADFCELGTARFINDLQHYPNSVVGKIKQTLIDRVQALINKGYSGDSAIKQVVPNCLTNIISFYEEI